MKVLGGGLDRLCWECEETNILLKCPSVCLSKPRLVISPPSLNFLSLLKSVSICFYSSFCVGLLSLLR